MVAQDMEPFFESIQDKLKSMSPEEIKGNIYIALQTICQVWSAYSEKAGEKGWSSALRTSSGANLFTRDEQEKIEEAFGYLAGEKGEEGQQSGGGGGGTTPPFTPGGVLLTKTEVNTKLTGDDVSLDKGFITFLNKMDDLDRFWAGISRENPGIYKLLTTGFTPIPIGPAPIPVPNSAIYTFILGLLETIRFFISVSPLDFSIGRYCTTILIIIHDAISGNWRQMILDSLGFYSQFGMFLSITGRLVLSAWLFMNPQVRSNLVYDLYKGFKSILIGFLLWSFQTFAPEQIKTMIVETALAQVRAFAQGLEQQIETLKSAANPVLQPSGYELQVKLDLETLKTISIDDFQNLQTLAQWGNFICANEVQSVLEPLYKDPIFRVVLELMGVPCTGEELTKICGADYKKPLAEVMKGQIQVVPSASVLKGGGGSRFSRRLLQLRLANRQTRRILKGAH